MKEKLQTALGSVGMFLFYLLIYTVAIAPLWYIGAPWWAYIIAAVITVVCHPIMGLLYVPLYIWSAFHVFQAPFTIGTVIWILGTIFALYEILRFVFFQFVYKES